MKGGIDVSLPLAVDPTDGAYALNKETPEAVKQNLKMLLLTSPGERIYRPSFGVGIRGYLFDQIQQTDTFAIRQEIIKQINLYMPYLFINYVNVEYLDQADPGLKVVISYRANDKVIYEDYFELTI